MDTDDDAQRLRRLNVAAAVGVVALGVALYAVSPFHARQLAARYGPPGWSFGGLSFLMSAAVLYALAVAVYGLSEPEPVESKSLRFWRLVRRGLSAPAGAWRTGLSEPERLALLTTLLKLFFAPLMVMSLMSFCTSAWTHGSALLALGWRDLGARVVFDRFGYWFLMQVILWVDVLIFTVGYLVESRRLGNEIRSVDSTWLGWLAALACYPPFNEVTRLILGSQVSDFPRFDDSTVHIALNLLLLALMAVYAWASVCMGWKASNLTYRGMVTHGPYAVLRHPAYASKNLAWWIGSAPVVMAAFERGWLAGLLSVGSVAGWTALYVLRALTEEDHLRKVEPGYDAYAQCVRYRFVPGLV